MLLILTQPALLITDVVIMGAEWTKTHFPNSKPQARFPSSVTDWNTGSEQMLFLAHLWALLHALMEKENLRSLLASICRNWQCCRESLSLAYRNCFGAGAMKAFLSTHFISEITHFSEKGSRKLSIAELNLHSLMTYALAKATSIILCCELHPVLVQNHMPSGNSLEELMQ